MKSEYVITIRPRRVAVGAGVTLLIVLALGAAVYGLRAPLLAWVGRQLVHVDDPAASDAIVVLAGGDPERELEAADLYRAGYAPLIVMTHDPEEPVLDVLRARGIETASHLERRLRDVRAFGVPDEAIILLEPEIKTTMEEAKAIAAWARARRATSVMVVTSAYHTARARFALVRALRGSGVTVRLRAAGAEPYEPAELWQRRIALRNSLFESQRLLFYHVRYCCR